MASTPEESAKAPTAAQSVPLPAAAAKSGPALAATTTTVFMPTKIWRHHRSLERLICPLDGRSTSRQLVGTRQTHGRSRTRTNIARSTTPSSAGMARHYQTLRLQSQRLRRTRTNAPIAHRNQLFHLKMPKSQVPQQTTDRMPQPETPELTLLHQLGPHKLPTANVYH